MARTAMPQLCGRDMATGELAHPSTQPRLTNRAGGFGLVPFCGFEFRFGL